METYKVRCINPGEGPGFTKGNVYLIKTVDPHNPWSFYANYTITDEYCKEHYAEKEVINSNITLYLSDNGALFE